jgi:large subunit ribosomal protein L29
MTRRVEKFREMNPNELEIQHRELSEQIFRLRFQLSSGQSEGLKKLREAKRDLARVNTLLRQAQLSRPQRAPVERNG